MLLADLQEGKEGCCSSGETGEESAFQQAGRKQNQF